MQPEDVEHRTLSTYTGALRPLLDAKAFLPARSRLVWLPLHAAIIGGIGWSVAGGFAPAVLWPLLAVITGCCFSAVVFLGHEVLHGSIVRGRPLIRLVGWICMLPFTLSPTLWTAWHNHHHHHRCGQAGADPDMYPTLLEYETNRSARIMADRFGLGCGRWMTLFSLLLGFTGQSQQMLWMARRKGLLSERRHRRAILETLLGVLFWAVVAASVGPLPFVVVYVAPLLIANTIVMMFIMTNHNLSPLTPTTNDPLLNSLSVTLPRALEWLTLDFGYHVEHHLFPTISSRHGRRIRSAVRTMFGERYQSMPLDTALHRVFTTARVYLNDTTLIDPRSGRTFATLLPGGPSSGNSRGAGQGDPCPATTIRGRHRPV
jgi:fatty acid desaturase